MPEFQHDVFLSYSEHDEALARSLAKRLQRDGLTVLLDEGQSPAGAGARAVIEEQLMHSRALVLCTSINILSPRMQSEVEFFRSSHADDYERRIISFQADANTAEDTHTKHLHINWRNNREQGYAQLLEVCRSLKAAPVTGEEVLSVAGSALDNLGVAVWVKDLQGRFMYANRVLGDLFAVDMNAIIGKSDSNFFSEDSAAKFRADDLLVLREQKRIDAYETVTLPNGQTQLHRTWKVALSDETGAVIGVLGISVGNSNIPELVQGVSKTIERLEKMGQESSRSNQSFIQGFTHALSALIPKVSLEHFPIGPSVLEGRDEEIVTLDRIWNAPDKTHIVQILGPGGSGKTALINFWLAQLRSNSWSGAQAVFAWSFYEQDVSDDRVFSIQAFLESALAFFGESNTRAMPPRDKVRRLVELVRGQRTLLILDGLELFQTPTGRDEGSIKQPEILEMLKELAQSHSGLCVITSRTPLRELDQFAMAEIKRLWLGSLSPHHGAQLLERVGVKGTTQELERTSQAFRGHPLILSLLGHYVVAAHDSMISSLEPFSAHPRFEANQLRLVLEAYTEWLGDGPEFELLLLRSILDASSSLLQVIFRKSAISGLTDHLAGLTATEWTDVCVRLRGLGLLAPLDPSRPEVLALHPLVKAHFAAVLKERFTAAGEVALQRFDEYLNRKAGPLRLYIDLDAYSEEEVVEIIECLSSLYEEMTEDRLVIDGQGMLDLSEIPEPTEA